MNGSSVIAVRSSAMMPAEIARSVGRKALRQIGISSKTP
jgi:hypothetical protein